MQFTGVAFRKDGAATTGLSPRLAVVGFLPAAMLDLSSTFLPGLDVLPHQPSVAAKRQRMS